MYGRRDRFSAVRAVVRAQAIAAASLACVGLAACSCAGDRPAPAPVPASERSGTDQELNVGNPSRGLDQQPDYDGEARLLHERMAQRLPDPLPSAREACTAMLDAAVQLYVAHEDDATSHRAVLRASHDADLRACEAETSPAAATCVKLLLDEQTGEWPWLLDQCSRAFPAV